MSGRQHLTTKQLNNQTTKQLNNYTIRFGWKPIPSEARVTRDGVSGYMMQRDSCLEDSTKTYKDIEMTKRIINKELSSRQFLPFSP